MTLVVERLAVRRGGRTVIDGVASTSRAGEIVGVVGKNGCGKSTLLSCIAGVLAPRDGRITIDGRLACGAHARERARAARALGYVPEARGPARLPARRRAVGAVRRDARGCPAVGRAARGPRPRRAARLALERMSLGQRRRACLGAALIGPPKLLVLDEPDNGLDATRLDALVTLLRDHATAGGATILASHDAAWLGKLDARVYTLAERPS